MIVVGGNARAQMWDDSSGDPWDRCAECHGLDGAGNHIKFPRLAGQKPAYIIKQLNDFRNGRRTNDGGQMQKTAAEIKEEDYPRVAKWFASQTPSWPKLTLEIDPDLARARKLWRSGTNGLDACFSCHSAAVFGLLDKAIIGPRIAGQRDFYIAKELTDYRAGQRRGNDPDHVMTTIASRLNDSDIASLAVFLSQNPALDDEVVP
jgi:cytochrome c553